MLAAAGLGSGTENWEEVSGLSMWVGRGVSIWVEDHRGNLLYILRGGKPWRLFSSEVNSEGCEGGGRTGRLLFSGLISEGCGLERVGNVDGEGCEMECEAK